MLEMGTSGLMSGDGKRGGVLRQYPRPSSTLPVALRSQRAKARNHNSLHVLVALLAMGASCGLQAEYVWHWTKAPKTVKHPVISSPIKPGR